MAVPISKYLIWFVIIILYRENGSDLKKAKGKSESTPKLTSG